MAVTTSHWYRPRGDDWTDPCAYSGCGQAPGDHMERCGEWTDPKHWFRLTLRRPSRCARCSRLWGHSTHRGSRKNRRLYPRWWR